MEQTDNHSIPADVRADVLECLDRIEREENVTIFLAVESGSRAWGFPSRDSDYDVRFLYVHERDWYLSIDLELKRDVIERPINDMLDISGWDLRKGLQLLRKSNPPLLEWLVSPIVYREKTGIASKFRELLPIYYSPRASLYHYLHMAKRNYREYLQSDTVRTKKYFYVLRPLLAIKWVEADLGPVPMEFGQLVDRLIDAPSLRREIDDLLLRKRSGDELDSGPRIAVFNAFIERELNRMESIHVEQVDEKRDLEVLNRFFRWAVGDEISANS